jgi:diazepam-binding inhibitor (GABA receptor modulating acyl-CoA-binding protein)
MDVEKRSFEESAECVMHLVAEPTNEDKLQIYGLFKQSTVGDVNIECPSIFNLSGRAKWYVWNEHKGKTVVQAKTEYVALVDRLVQSIGLNVM